MFPESSGPLADSCVVVVVVERGPLPGLSLLHQRAAPKPTMIRRRRVKTNLPLAVMAIEGLRTKEFRDGASAKRRRSDAATDDRMKIERTGGCEEQARYVSEIFCRSSCGAGVAVVAAASG